MKKTIYGNGYAFDVNHPVSLVLEEDVETIESNAFYFCSMFSSVSLPSTVTSIGNSAFYGCTGLNYALYLGAEEGGSAVAIGSNNEPLLSRLLWYRAPDFTLPAALSSIEDEAFCGIAAVSVRLPETVTGIGDRAFADCPALRQIIIPTGVTEIDEDAFAGVERLLIVGVPGSSAEQFAAARGYAFLSR